MFEPMEPGRWESGTSKHMARKGGILEGNGNEYEEAIFEV